MINTASLSAYDFAIEVGELPSEMILALAQHGFKQKLGDAAAMTKEEKAELGSEEAVAAKIAERRKAIVQNLREGKFSAGGTAGPRLKGLDAIVRDVAIERLKAAFSAKSIKWPTGKGSAERIAELVGKLVAKHGDDIRAEAERRMASLADVDDIL